MVFLLCSGVTELVIMLLGLILSATGIVLFAWAMFRLAVFALPVGLGAAVFLWAAGSGPGPLLGLLFGVIVGVAAFLIGRLAVASRLPVPLRAGTALLFAVPAGIAGYNIVSGLMHLGRAGPTATSIIAVIGAIVVAGAAMMSLLPSMTDPAGPQGSPLRN